MLLSVRWIRAAGTFAVISSIVACGPDGDQPLLRALVLSDLNGPSGSLFYPAEVTQAVALARGELRPDVVLIPGDMIAGQAPNLPDRRVRAMWDVFDATIAAPLREAGIPIVFTLGNHDGAAQPQHARDRRMAAEYWRSRVDADDLPFVNHEQFPFTYSVRFRDVFIAVWDATNGASGANDDLVDWLGDALESDAAEEAKHRIVLAHVPLYDVSSPPYYPDGVLDDADDLREKLEDWDATMMLSGHHHAYYPGRRGALELLHAGSLGTYPRTLRGDPGPPLKTITVLDFYPDSVGVTTYALDAARNAATPVPLENLPHAICAQNGWVTRRDMATLEPDCPRRSRWHRFIDRLGF